MINPHTTIPATRSKEDETLSEDVLIRNESGRLRIAFYDFQNEEWVFEDQDCNPFSRENKEAFVWMYIPKELSLERFVTNRIVKQ